MASLPQEKGEDELARRIARQLWLKFLLILVLLAAASASAYAIFHVMTANQERAAALINEAGRQRLLPQRIVLTLQAGTTAMNPAERSRLEQEAGELLSQLVRNHESINYASAGWEARKLVHEVRSAPPHELDRRLAEFAALGQALLADPPRTLFDPRLLHLQGEAGGPLLEAIDLVASAVEEGARNGAHDLKMLASIGEGLFLVLLALMALTVFRPLVQQTGTGIAQLSSLQRYHQAVVEAQADALVEIDPLRRTVTPINPAAHQMFKLETSEPMPLVDLIPAASLLTPASLVDWDGYEVEAVRRDGTPFAAEVTVRETTVEGTVKWIGVVRDVSRRVEAEHRAHILLAALEHSPASVVVTDPAGKIEYVNRKFCEVSGYARDEVLGQSSSILKSGRTPETVYSEMWKTLATGREWRGEMLNRKKSGELFWEHVAISPLRDRRGEVAHYMAVKEDVTERKAMEHDLVEAKLRAERASRAKSDFLATMSHELRTPLNAIIGFSDLMQAELFGPLGNANYTAYVKDIRDSGYHLLDLINDVLDLSKVEAGKIELEEEEVDVRRAFEAVLRLVSERAERSGVSIANEVAGGLPALWADSLRIKQVLLNLMTNAIKFTPEGGRIVVSGRLVPQGLELAVSDTGIGIAAEDIPKVMEPFGQADNPLVRKETGTGLGLPLSKRLVELQGGQLSLHSRLGQGTTVVLSFPPERLRHRQPARV